MRRILLVEDDFQIRKAMTASLSAMYQVVACGTLSEADVALTQTPPDLILLDVHLPDGDGFRYCAKLRTVSGLGDVPIIFLTGHGDPTEKVMGLSLGADDYITKPFEMSELKARIDVQLRRMAKTKEVKQELRVRDLFLSSNFQKAKIFSRDGNEISVDLTSLEFRLLFHLASNEDQVFSREQLLNSIWGNALHVTDRTVDSHVSQLRKKIASSQMTITAVHNVGYKFTQRDSSAIKKKAA